MSTIDVSSFQSDAGTTSVLMPQGDTIELRPIMQLGPEHDSTLLDMIGKLEKLTKPKGKGPKGGKTRNPQARDSVDLDLSQLGEIMPLVGGLLKAAAPDEESGERIMRLPMMARFQILMGYFEDQDLGGLFPSES